MRKIGHVALVFALLVATLVAVPEARACDAEICEEVTGCYGCVWYGVLFINCFLGGCNSCATQRCQSFSASETAADASDDLLLGPNECEQELQPRSEIEIVDVEVLPART